VSNYFFGPPYMNISVYFRQSCQFMHMLLNCVSANTMSHHSTVLNVTFCTSAQARLAGGAVMFSVCPSVGSSVRPSIQRYEYEHNILKTNEPILMPIGTTASRGNETINFFGRGQGNQGRMRLNIEMEAWRRHHFRSLWVE